MYSLHVTLAISSGPHVFPTFMTHSLILLSDPEQLK